MKSWQVTLCVLAFLIVVVGVAVFGSRGFIGATDVETVVLEPGEAVLVRCAAPLPTSTATQTPTSVPTSTMTPAPTATPTATPTPTEYPRRRFVGIMAVNDSADFGAVASLGMSVVSNQTYQADLSPSLQAAKSQGLQLLGRAQSRRAFQSGTKIDFIKLEQIISAVFSGNDIASDPDFFGYYIIDEPCHPGKWGITPSEMRQFYQTVKGVDPDIQVMVNFGQLGCVESFANGGEFVDIAGFTITMKKHQQTGYVTDQAAAAQQLKAKYPSLRVVALIAVYEYPARGIPLPSADWVRQVGMEVLSYDVFDGIMFYPWSPSSYMGDTIEDIADNPEYITAFQAVVEEGKWGN